MQWLAGARKQSPPFVVQRPHTHAPVVTPGRDDGTPPSGRLNAPPPAQLDDEGELSRIQSGGGQQAKGSSPIDEVS